jgi:excisionase family DNA binding protein
MIEKLYTPERAAEALMVSPKTVREWLRTGKLGGVKVGRLWRVRESDLEAFLGGGGQATGKEVPEITCGGMVPKCIA